MKLIRILQIINTFQKIIKSCFSKSYHSSFEKYLLNNQLFAYRQLVNGNGVNPLL